MSDVTLPIPAAMETLRVTGLQSWGLYNLLVDCYRNDSVIELRVVSSDARRQHGRTPEAQALRLAVEAPPVLLDDGSSRFMLRNEEGHAAVLDISQVKATTSLSFVA